MWCAKCQADVAAIASADNQRARCSTCGTELLVAAAADQSGPIPRDPQELLARWAQEDANNPLHDLPPLVVDRDARGKSEDRPNPRKKPLQRRFDAQHPVNPATRTSEQPAERTNTTPPMPPVVASSSGYHGDRDVIVHPPHALAGTPHFEAAALIAQRNKSRKSTRWVTLAGQIAAYIGVGTLTIGASMVLMAYFGGPENYAPLGWLVTTAGQMLLFLGVVTLVSGGMEQTTQQVTDRIDDLGAHIIRLEEYRAMKSEKEVKSDVA